MIIDYEKLKTSIEANNENNLNVDELMKSAIIWNEFYVKVENKQCFMIFDEDYNCVDGVINQPPAPEKSEECEVL